MEVIFKFDLEKEQLKFDKFLKAEEMFDCIKKTYSYILKIKKKYEDSEKIIQDETIDLLINIIDQMDGYVQYYELVGLFNEV